MRKKMEELEKKYPHVDLASLFVSDKTEAAQQALHKRAFASYKAHEFLKAGVTKEVQEAKQDKSSVKKRMQENDPYNFPELDATLAKVLSKDISEPHVIDHGEPLHKSGRRFTPLTETEFLDAYFGKDLMRLQAVDRSDDPLFREHKSMKERYPLQQFLKMPDIEKKKKQIAELGLMPTYKDIDFFDKTGAVQINSNDPGFDKQAHWWKELMLEGNIFKDVRHPKVAGRTLLTDFDKLMDKYEESI